MLNLSIRFLKLNKGKKKTNSYGNNFLAIQEKTSISPHLVAYLLYSKRENDLYSYWKVILQAYYVCIYSSSISILCMDLVHRIYMINQLIKIKPVHLKSI